MENLRLPLGAWVEALLDFIGAVFGWLFDAIALALGAIYEGLEARVETGWAHGDFQKSVWGRRLVNKAESGDSWKVAFGLTYLGGYVGAYSLLAAIAILNVILFWITDTSPVA